jgi:hypothetical protein
MQAAKARSSPGSSFARKSSFWSVRKILRINSTKSSLVTRPHPFDGK